MIGNRLRELRIEKGLLQKDLAEILQITQQTISLYESNQREPDNQTLIKIANYFNVSVDYLLNRTNIKNIYNEIPKTSINISDYHTLDKLGLPKEAIREIEDYIEYIILKYNLKATSKKRKKIVE